MDGIAGTWLSLALPHDGFVWTDRTSEMRAMRAQGVTLAEIGKRFGVRAQRVWQILDQD